MKKITDAIESMLALGGARKDIALLTVSAIAIVISMAKPFSLPFDAAWIAIILCGLPIIIGAVTGLVTEFDIKADVLVSIALIASVCIGEYFAAAEIAVIMQLGAFLEELTVAKARAGIEKLVRLTPRTARIVADGAERVVPSEEVRIGDILRVLPGEAIAVDGVIVSGQTSINQAILTGESLPVDKGVGDAVSSGTVNQFGVFEMQATRTVEDSSVARMVQLVQSADAGKAKIVGIADRWATWIVVIALTAAAITWAASSEIIRAVTILVVFCPCAMVLATPTAIMAAIGNCTKHGFLVREGDALERLARVSVIAFDKTGTLTHGTPSVAAVKSFDEKISDEELYSLVAAAEQFSEHPLGKAVSASFVSDKGCMLLPAGGFEMLPGRGVLACVAEKEVLAGNELLLREKGIAISDILRESGESYAEKGCTLIYVALDSRSTGFLALSDTLRTESTDMIAQLNSLGIKTALLTGDNRNAAAAIASGLGISEYHAGCLPEDKLERIEEYQKSGQKTCMIGDGINDAPSLKRAYVGIAMAAVGSDIAVDAADIALVDDEVKELPHLLALSSRMMKTIKLNLSFSLGLNFVAIILAITGVFDPVVGALVHNAGSVLVIINSALLLGWRRKRV